jgi:hypothetical protein
MLAVVLLATLITFFTVRAIANIKPRVYSEPQVFTEQPKNDVMTKDETITMEEFMKRTPRKLENELVEIDGKFCLKEGVIIKWCE